MPAARHRHPVDQVVGGAAGASSATIALTITRSSTSCPIGVKRAALADREHAAHRLARQRLAQPGMRVHEGRAGHVQAHGPSSIWLLLAVP